MTENEKLAHQHERHTIVAELQVQHEEENPTNYTEEYNIHSIKDKIYKVYFRNRFDRKHEPEDYGREFFGQAMAFESEL